MSPEFRQSVRQVYEPLLGRKMTPYEVEEYGFEILHFVAFLEDCVRDRRLVRKMGTRREK